MRPICMRITREQDDLCESDTDGRFRTSTEFHSIGHVTFLLSQETPLLVQRELKRNNSKRQNCFLGFISVSQVCGPHTVVFTLCTPKYPPSAFLGISLKPQYDYQMCLQNLELK